ncbi:hypothetical protein P9D43_00565 [Neobacillus niacini]|uniref:hypothetical protein n=1 Tax=Neobacillus niacini TaxID=86668 RepID=UPI0007AB7DB2|nr:hypothetical protein [Neobacillus niacini]MEC1520521.1 hypothetical protein [Neobacillus niacini]
MGDFTSDTSQLSKEKRSIFDSSKFWGQRPKHRNSLSIEIEKSPTITIEEDSAINHAPKENRDEVNPSRMRLHDTIRGDYIITRGWEGNNMLVYKIRRKN